MHSRGCSSYVMIAFVHIGAGAINAMASSGVVIVISPLAFDRLVDLQNVEFRMIVYFPSR